MTYDSGSSDATSSRTSSADRQLPDNARGGAEVDDSRTRPLVDPDSSSFVDLNDLDGFDLRPGSLPPTVRGRGHDSSHHNVFPANKVLGSFRIEGLIGRGGMGLVYAAFDMDLNRRVALKVLPASALLDNLQMRRFKNEAAAAAHLSHAHIVPIHSSGNVEGIHYYAMQLIEGRNLAQVLGSIRERLSTQHALKRPSAETAVASSQRTTKSGWSVFRDRDKLARSSEPWREVDFAADDHAAKQPRTRVKWFKSIAAKCRDAAQAIGYAHDCGVIHRDIKPSNLMLDGRGHLWITDFGLAHFRHNPMGTATGDIVGTYRYMSPEQASGRKLLIDHRTDIYSLGATLYELLALQPAFTGNDPVELLRKAAYEEPLGLRKVNPQIPIELETIAAKAMAKNPNDRYLTAHELAEDLDRFCNDQPIAAKPPNVLQRIRRWSSRNPAIVGMLVVAFATAFVGLASFSTILAAQYKQEVRLKEEVTEMYQSLQAAFYTSKASNELHQNPGLALALARESAEFSPTIEAKQTLQAALEVNHELRHLPIRTSSTQNLRLSADGHKLLSTASPNSGVDNRVAIITDLRSGDELIRIEAEHDILAAELSPDGTRVITLCKAGDDPQATDLQVTLWDTISGKAIRTLPAYSMTQLSDDLFNRTNQTLVLPDAENSATVRRLSDLTVDFNLQGHVSPVSLAVVSANGRYLATADISGEIRVWKAGDGDIVKVITGDGFKPGAIRFTADAHYLVASGTLPNSESSETRVFQVEEGGSEPLSHWPEAKFVLSPDSRHCATFNSIDSRVKIRDVRSGETISELQLKEFIFAKGESVVAAFASPYEIAVASGTEVSVFNTLRGEWLYGLAGHSNIVRHIVHSESLQNWITCSRDKTVRTWSSMSGLQRMQMPAKFDTRSSDAIVFDTDHKTLLASCCYTDKVKVFSAKGEPLPGTFAGALTSRRFDENRLLVIADNMLKVVDCTTGRVVHQIEGPKRIATAQAMPQANACIIGTSDGGCYFWQYGEFQYKPLLALGEVQTCFRLADEGEHFAIGTNTGKCRVFDARSGASLRTISHPTRLTNIEFLGANQIVTVDEESHLRVWGDDDVVPQKLFREAGSRISGCRIDAANNLLFTFSERSSSPIVCWDTTTWEKKGTIDGVGHSQIMLDPARRKLIQGSTKGIRVWDYENDSTVQLSDNETLSLAMLPGLVISVEVANQEDALQLRWSSPQTQFRVVRGYSLDSLSLLFEETDLAGEVQRVLCVDQASERFAVAVRSFHATAWPIAEGASKLIEIGEHNAPLAFSDFYGSNLVVTASWDGVVGIWTTAGEPQSKVELSGSVTVAQRHGSTLACGLADGTIAIVDLNSQGFHVLDDGLNKSALHGLSFSSDGQQLLASHQDDRLVHWNLPNRVPRQLPVVGNIGTFVQNDQGILVWQSSSSQPIANRGEDEKPQAAMIVDVVKFEPLASLPNSAGVSKVCVSHDGKQIVTLFDGTWRSYKKDSSGTYAEQVWSLDSIVDPNIQDIGLSPSGKLLAIAEHRRLQIFDLEERKQLFSYDLPSGGRLRSRQTWNPFSQDECWIGFLDGQRLNYRSLNLMETVSQLSQRRLSPAEMRMLGALDVGLEKESGAKGD